MALLEHQNMTRNPRLLITGASGFIGSHCLDAAEHQFETIMAISRSPQAHAATSVIWKQFDLLRNDPQRLMASVRPTHLLHLAWEATPGHYWQSPRNEHWAAASHALIDAFHAAGGDRLVVVGTCAEYDWQSENCHEYATPLARNTPYAAAKIKLYESVVRDRPNAAWARPFFVFGPGEPRQKLIPYVITQLLQGLRADCSAGYQQRDFVYVKDVAGALIQLLKSPVAGPVNVGTGTAYRVRDVARKIAQLLKRQDLVHFDKRAGVVDSQTVRADCGRLANEVGFHAKYSLNEALEESIAWWSSILAEERELGTAYAHHD